MNNSIKDEFRKDGKVKIPEQSLELSKPGKRGSAKTLGHEWHQELRKIGREEGGKAVL